MSELPRASLNLRDLLGLLCEEIKARLRLALPIPTGTSERLSVFLGPLLGVPPRSAWWWSWTGSRLDPEQDAHTLHWLPSRSHVKIIVSCRDRPATRIRS